MCVDCVLASPRIAQADPSNGPLPEVVLSQWLKDHVAAIGSQTQHFGLVDGTWLN
jgi:hypothetical protein